MKHIKISYEITDENGDKIESLSSYFQTNHFESLVMILHQIQQGVIIANNNDIITDVELAQ